MNFRAVHTLSLTSALVTTTAAQTEVDLAKLYVNPGKREMKAGLCAILTVSSDSGTLAYKLQESATTVDSDFADITGAAFTTVGDSDTAGVETIHFFTSERYVRGHATVTGTTSYGVSAWLQLFKRDA